MASQQIIFDLSDQQEAAVMVKNLSRYRTQLKKEQIYLSFAGPLSQSLLEDVVNIVRKKMALEGEKKSTIMSVFSIAVEQVQNMIRYSAEMVPDNEANAEFRFGLLLVGREGEYYVVSSGNLIETEKIPELKRHLARLQGMDQEALKQLYKKERRKTPGPNTRSAGLGLIEIARKSSLPVEFEFQSLEHDSRSFFSIKATVS